MAFEAAPTLLSGRRELQIRQWRVRRKGARQVASNERVMPGLDPPQKTIGKIHSRSVRRRIEHRIVALERSYIVLIGKNRLPT